MVDTWIAILAAFTSPVMLAVITHFLGRKSQKRQWDRQDLMDKKLEVIRVDVNSNLTKALEKIESLKGQLIDVGETPNTNDTNPSA